MSAGSNILDVAAVSSVDIVASGFPTIDGYTIKPGDYVLLTGQGIFQAASGPWTPLDVTGVVLVQNGTAFQGSQWGYVDGSWELLVSPLSSDATSIQGVPVSNAAVTDGDTLVVEGGEYVPTAPGPALPTWFLTSSTTGSNGPPLGTVTPPTDTTPYLYWDDTDGSGLWITRLSADASQWLGLGRLQTGTPAPGLSLGSYAILSGGNEGGVLEAINGSDYWMLFLEAGGAGYFNMAPLLYVSSSNYNGRMVVSVGDPNTLGISGSPNQLCIDMADNSTGIWQWDSASSVWQPYGYDDYPLVYAIMGVQGSLPQNLIFSQFPLLTARVAITPGDVYGVLTSLPTLVAPISQVTGIPTFQISNLDTTQDDLVIGATLLVTSLDTTQAISVTANGDIAQSGPGQNGSIDWTTATPTAISGTDLTWDDSIGVSSTAGGIFMASLTYSTSWD